MHISGTRLGSSWLRAAVGPRWIYSFLLITLFCALTVTGAALTAEQQQWVAKAHRFQRAGWIYLHLEGDGKCRGFQHGYLLAPEIADAMRSIQVNWQHESAMEWSWLVKKASELFVPRIDPENRGELEGLAEGMKAAGQGTSFEEMVAYNGYIELCWYWWPSELKKIKEGPAPPVPEGCSAFIATGRMTRDGNIVLGHNTMMEYQDVFPNVIADIAPAQGHRILWQTSPGWIHSGTDFFITDAGLVGAETTIGSFEGFETNGVPEFTRMRRATQDAGSIDQWCQIMRRGNNGGYANAWLLGDINTREIGRLELGLKQVAFEKKSDGYFIGSNIAEDLKLRRFETSTHDTDIRDSAVGRRVRWKQLMKAFAGRIDLEAAKEFEADHFDCYLEKREPTGRTLCGHYELSRDPAGPWPGVPFGAAGTVDGKVVDAAMAKNMTFAARWGAACGHAFDARQYLAAHPQFDWMEGILKSRPSQPWTQFKAGEPAR